MVKESYIILNNPLIQKNSPGLGISIKKLLIDPIAEGLYKDFQTIILSMISSNTLDKEFKDLSKAEKSFWYNYAAEIPNKFRYLNLFIRPFEDFCRTCIITDNEIQYLFISTRQVLQRDDSDGIAVKSTGTNK